MTRSTGIPQGWLTLKQVAPRVGLDASTVGKWARRKAFGELRIRLVNGRWHRLVRASAVKTFNAGAVRG